MFTNFAVKQSQIICSISNQESRILVTKCRVLFKHSNQRLLWHGKDRRGRCPTSHHFNQRLLRMIFSVVFTIILVDRNMETNKCAECVFLGKTSHSSEECFTIDNETYGGAFNFKSCVLDRTARSAFTSFFQVKKSLLLFYLDASDYVFVFIIHKFEKSPSSTNLGARHGGVLGWKQR